MAQGEIYGTVTNEKGQPFEGVIIKVTQGGLLKSGSVSEDDGSYSVKPLQPGTYDIEFSSISYETIKVSGVEITLGGTKKQDVRMEIQGSGSGKVLNQVVVKARKPVIGVVSVTQAKNIEAAPTTNIIDMAGLSKNVYQARSGGALSIGGARPEGTVYIIDGQVSQVGGAINPPQGTVQQLQVFSSGIPANLGDATGGVVSITTKGATSSLKGNIRAQHSIDGYNQNLINGSITGPLLSREKDGQKQPILGFLLGAEYQYYADDNPTYYKNPVLKKDVLKNLQENPLTLVNSQNSTTMVATSNFVTKDDFTYQKQQLNNSSTTVRLNGKLDYAINSNINITAGGNFTYGSSDGYSRAASYFAPESIPVQTDYTGRGYLRFKQSFPNAAVKKSDSGGRTKPVISNAYYTLQLDYQITKSNTEHPNFKHNLFDYGYVGKFTQSRVPIYAYGKDSLSGRDGIILQTYDAVSGISFQASDKNPILAAYTQAVFNNASKLNFLSDYTTVQAYNGLMNGDFPRSALSVQNVGISGVGAAMTGYSYSTFNQYGLHADASFDFRPGKSKNAITHAIQFGLYYEQRSSSSYSASITNGTGTSLWLQMLSLANNHIGSLDYSNPIYIHNGQRYTKDQIDAGGFFLPTDTVIYERRDNGQQSTFDKNLRSTLGAGKNDYLDVYSVDPSKLSLGMFSASELLGASPNSNYVSYNGYDYTGQKLKGTVSFNDFFTQKDAAGNLTRPIGAFSPNYIAGYIMDAFRYKSLQFNVGVRFERYDANTKVLKDPYSLYEARTVSQTDASLNANGVHPGTVSQSAMVYVDNNNSSSPSIVAYRDGDKWYDANGVEAVDPTVFEKKLGAPIAPYLTTAGKVNITDSKFDPNNSFTDYKPKVTASPRFQFQFPINDDDALFYAHYDILVQRPKVGNYANALDYYFLEQNQGTAIGNPNLKPEKTFDYELGFMQSLGKRKNAGIGISAFYRERKDMIQLRAYQNAYPKLYYSYGNRDFSTTKGFTFTYNYTSPDPKVLPLELSVNYTLQFADGTGSSATSGSGLLQNFQTAGLPNLRYVAPLSYDSRHNINLNLLYTYGQGEGPEINGKHILQNLRANMILRARSGEPYTTSSAVNNNVIQGTLNGTRLGWHFGADLRIDKGFTIDGFSKKRKQADGTTVVSSNAGGRKYNVGAFIYFQNIFNIRDVLQVYPYTSRPDDDGYVTSSVGKQYFTASYSPQSLQDLYSLYVNNPDYYNAPRRINIGFTFAF
ncbi:hypothetical protein GCM10023092_07390 [Rurimicrobium arvi]|uniref:TonB-dependent receptor-like beta-barrel domain-containing protein n=2 Tax=Rurimicrobium arvi TaxID=2049916 RepID=A0ABP8MIB2_9BACT